jgi:hypothetical protein
MDREAFGEIESPVIRASQGTTGFALDKCRGMMVIVSEEYFWISSCAGQ